MVDLRDDLRSFDDRVLSDNDDDDFAAERFRRYRIDDVASDDSLHGISRKRQMRTEEPYHSVRSGFKIEEPSSAEMTSIVIEYLIVEGFPESAKALAAEARINLEDSDWVEIEKRVEIKKDIIEGKIAEAIDKLNALCPGIVESEAAVRFDLYLQRFLELIRENDVFSALDWSSEKLSTENLDEAQLMRVEQACTLAAFDNPNECKFANLLDQGQRELVAETVNGAILKSQGKPITSRVETMFKMKMFMHLNLPDPVDRGQAAEERIATEINKDIMSALPFAQI